MQAPDPATSSVTIFVKRPTPGTVKTRLAASIGADAATAFYKACAEHAVAAAVGVDGARVTVAYAPHDAGDDVRAWLSARVDTAGVKFEAQDEDGDLGVRMHAALARGLATCGKTVIIGSDVPDVSSAAIEAALAALPRSPPCLVLGPALDGGYWCVGVTAAPRGLFDGTAWSTASAAADTRAAAERAGLRVVEAADVPALADVDTVQDLTAWRATATPHHPLLPAADAALVAADAGLVAPPRGMRLRLLLFARARELAGVSETSLEVEPGTTTAGLQDAIVAAYPALAEIKDAIVLAVNQSYVDGEARPLAEGDEVAVIPPISGG